jgi:beta-lactamase regulating signal transducer with metallopeptidase domain
MTAWLESGLSNALVATLLAVVACVVTRASRNPKIVFAAWVLVLAKLVTPPLVGLPLESLRPRWQVIEAPVAGHALALPPLANPYATLPAPTAEIDDAVTVVSADVDSERLGSGRVLLSESFLAPIEADQRDMALVDSPDEAARSDASAWGAIPLLFGLWLAGSALWFAVAAARIARFGRFLRLARLAPGALQAEVRALALGMNLRQAPTVRLVNRRVPPLVWAMTGPATILLPVALVRGLSDEQRSALLAHELVHLKRHDHLVRWLELAVLGLYWWHPVAWWARRNVERAAEHCCDAEVMAMFPQQARSYAEALWTTVDFLSDSRPAMPLGAQAFSQAGHVRRRMEMILQGTVARRVGWPLRWTIVAIGLAVLPLSIRTLWADPPVGPQAEPAATAEPEAPAAIDPVVAVELVGSDEATSSAALSGSVAVEESTEEIASAEPSPSVEERLDRLEKMIQALAERGQTGATEKTKPKTVVVKAAPPASDKSPGKGKPTLKDKSHGDTKSPDDDKSIPLSIELAPDATIEIERFLVDAMRQAAINLELAKTNLARYEAATRQVQAVKKAFEADTVNVDQLLEAQRRVAEAYSAYIRNAGELSTSPERSLFVAKAQLMSANRALQDAKETWKKIHEAATPGSAEEKAEAMAREQYYQFKMQAQALLNEYHQAQSRISALAGSPTQKGLEWLTSEAARHQSKKDEVRRQAEKKLSASGFLLERAKAEKIREEARREIERAKREAEAARRQLEALERHVKAREAEAATAAAKAEAAAKNLEAVEAAEKASQEAKKPEKQ